MDKKNKKKKDQSVVQGVNPIIAAPGGCEVGLCPAIHGGTMAGIGTTSAVAESRIDYPASEDLCSDIWDGDRKIREDVKQRALEIVDMLSAHYGIHPVGVNVVGSICSNQYRPNADIDVHIQVEMTSEAAQNLNNDFYFDKSTLLKGVDIMVGENKNHPLEFWFQNNIYSDLASYGCYDLMNDKWLREPMIVGMDFDPYDEYKDSFEEAMTFGKRAQIAVFQLEKDVQMHHQMMFWYADTSEVQMRIERKKEELNDAMVENIRELASIYEEFMRIRKRVCVSPRNDKESDELRNNTDWKNADATYKFLQAFGVINKCKNIAELYYKYYKGEMEIGYVWYYLEAELHDGCVMR